MSTLREYLKPKPPLKYTMQEWCKIGSKENKLLQLWKSWIGVDGHSKAIFVKDPASVFVGWDHASRTSGQSNTYY